MQSEEEKKKISQWLSRMTRAQKARLVTGADYWHTQGIPELDLPGLCLSDGPHGLRKQPADADYTGLHPSLPAVCFPSAALCACSFDPHLLFEMGKALGREAAVQNVDVLLGPGINIKRTPWCGRNFEYYSEDPYLSGVLSAAYIQGVQSQKTSAALKHFACNSQENYRMTENSILKPSVLAQLYTPAFQYAIRNSQPHFLMSSYNKINGVYASENAGLLALAKAWGFDGINVTDWGSLNDVLPSFQNGTDLEMPGLSKGSDAIVEKELSEKRLNEIAEKMLTALLRAKEKKEELEPDQVVKANRKLADRIVRESAVLLQNKNQTLPLALDTKVALIGDLAAHPRYQGAGSSRVHPVCVESLCTAFENSGIDFLFSQGVDAKGQTSEEKIRQALAVAAKCDVSILVLGLPEEYESEGYDRSTLQLPAGMTRLVQALHTLHVPIVVILQCGSVCELEFLDDIQSLLLVYLSGENGAQAITDLLFGKACPSGKLAETWVKHMEDVPIQIETKEVHYQEGMYSGYRYYFHHPEAVRFPFGFGLLYAHVQPSASRLETTEGKTWNFSVLLENPSKYPAKQTVQLYIEKPGSPTLLELKGFEKTEVLPAAIARTQLQLQLEDFALFEDEDLSWKVKAGTYRVHAGFDSQNFFFIQDVVFEQDIVLSMPEAEKQAWRQLKADYENVFTGEKKPVKKYSQNTTIEELCAQNRLYAWLFSRIIHHVLKKEENETNRKILKATIEQMPVRLAGMYGLNKNQLEAVVHFLNHEYIQAVKKAFG